MIGSNGWLASLTPSDRDQTAYYLIETCIEEESLSPRSVIHLIMAMVRRDPEFMCTLFDRIETNPDAPLPPFPREIAEAMLDLLKSAVAGDASKFGEEEVPA